MGAIAIQAWHCFTPWLKETSQSRWLICQSNRQEAAWWSQRRRQVRDMSSAVLSLQAIDKPMSWEQILKCMWRSSAPLYYFERKTLLKESNFENQIRLVRALQRSVKLVRSTYYWGVTLNRYRLQCTVFIWKPNVSHDSLLHCLFVEAVYWSMTCPCWELSQVPFYNWPANPGSSNPLHYCMARNHDEPGSDM